MINSRCNTCNDFGWRYPSWPWILEFSFVIEMVIWLLHFYRTSLQISNTVSCIITHFICPFLKCKIVTQRNDTKNPSNWFCIPDNFCQFHYQNTCSNQDTKYNWNQFHELNNPSKSQIGYRSSKVKKWLWFLDTVVLKWFWIFHWKCSHYGRLQFVHEPDFQIFSLKLISNFTM